MTALWPRSDPARQLTWSSDTLSEPLPTKPLIKKLSTMLLLHLTSLILVTCSQVDAGHQKGFEVVLFGDHPCSADNPCNPRSNKPCCSKWNFCGITSQYCSCIGCVDSRKHEIPTQPATPSTPTTQKSRVVIPVPKPPITIIVHVNADVDVNSNAAVKAIANAAVNSF